MSTKISFWKPSVARPIGGVFQKDFVTTMKNGIDVPGHLPSSASIAQAEFVQAALETGYGPQHAWPATLWMEAAQQVELGHFLGQRAQSLASMFDFDAGRMLPKGFSKCLESSEWSAMSYMVGQIAATIAIRQWLGLSRAPIEVLHKSVYANASLVKTTIHSVPKSVTIKLVPDMLVKDSQAGWHILAAKGGKANYRARAVNKGLAQVDSHDRIRTGGSLHVPQSRICSFVQIDRPTKEQRALRIDVVDPDGPEDGSELIVFEDLALAMSRLLIDATLRSLPMALVDRTPLEPIPGFVWRRTGSGDVLVAVPDAAKEAADVPIAVALMLETRRRLTRQGARRIRKPRLIAIDIVRRAAPVTTGLRDPLTEKESASYASMIEQALDNASGMSSPISSVWDALSVSLQLDRRSRDVREDRIAGAEGVLSNRQSSMGQSGAVYVKVDGRNA